MTHIPLSQAFHLPMGGGQRLCVHHPANGQAARASILYVHPFAEEMNKSRRMAALQSRALAAMGYSVLQIDLHGCGDSSGDLGDATSHSWFQDIAVAWDWLQANIHQSVILWGLRLGATLALDFARSQKRWPAGFLLWQPVLNGESHMTQFLRLRVASEMLEGAKTGGTRVLRETLERGEPQEVAGYWLNPELVRYIDSLQLTEIAPDGVPVCWLEVVAEEGQTVSPGTARTADAWRQANVDFTLDTPVGPAFWATQEITDCPALLARTMDCIDRLGA